MLADPPTSSQPPPGLDSSSELVCAHCGLPANVSEGRAHNGRSFCCAGCQTAWGIIHGAGLDEYYRVLDAAASERHRATGSGDGFSEFDDPAFSSAYARPQPGGLFSCELLLEGVHCAACVWLVERLPRVVPGVVQSRLDVRRSRCHIVWDPARTTLSHAARGLDSFGYRPHPDREGRAAEARRREDRTMMIRLAVAGACAGNVMLLALALYAGLFDEIESPYLTLFRWTSMGITVLSLAWPGAIFFRGALAALRTRSIHLDVPIALGLLTGGLWGVVNTVRGTGEIYFDSLAILVFVLLVGRWLQRSQQRRAADSLSLLYSLTPTSARLLENGATRIVPVESLAPGASIEVLAGDSVPADGVILEGRTAFDLSLLTGESRPIEVGPGDETAAGTVNLGSRIALRVTATGESTRVARLMKLVEEASTRRGPIVRLADRVSGWFLAGMLALAGITLAAWLWLDPSRAVEHAVALLIVTCPCALGLATPMTMTVAIGRAARRGILIKGGDALETLPRPGLIYLDKTGTITEGKTRLVRWIGDDTVRPLVGALERGSSHPIARALTEALFEAESPPPVKNDRSTLGGGIEGTVAGRSVVVGSPAFVSARANTPPRTILLALSELLTSGLTPVMIAVDGEVVALAGLGDPIRSDSLEAISRLRAEGWRVGVLSGDHPELVSAVAGSLGVEPGLVRGGVSPEDKLAIVREASVHGTVVMVGDGVNDAAALAAATVGIAVHGGAEASLAAADVYLARPGLSPLLELTSGARRTMSVIRGDFAAALAYNVLAATLAVTGVINPLIAAILMPLSSLTVVTLSLRARTFGGEPCR